MYKLLVSGALTSSFIPVFSNYLHKNRQEAQELASSVLSILTSVFTITAIILFIFAEPIVKIVTPGFTQSQLSLLVPATRVLLLSQIFFLVSNFLTGIIQTHQIFLIPSLSPLVYNAAIIISIPLLGPTMGIQGVVLGALVGSLLHLGIQIPVIKKLDIRLSWRPNIHTPGVMQVLKLMGPRTASIGLAELESTLVLFCATTFKTGSLSLLNLALQVVYLPSRVFGATLGQATLPSLSKNIAKNEIDKFEQTLTSIILQTTYLALPVTVLCLVNRVPIIRLAFGARSFPWGATLDTAEALLYLTPTIIAQALVQIVNRAFYALHNTKTPLYIAILSLLTLVITSSVLSTQTSLGIVGLALATSLSSIVQLVGLWIGFTLLAPGKYWTRIYNGLIKIMLSAAMMAFIMWFTMKFIDIYILDTTKTINVLLVFAGSSLFGFGVYIITSMILKCEPAEDIARQVGKRLHK